VGVESRKLASILTQINQMGVEYVLVGEDIEQLRVEVNGDVDIVFRRETIDHIWSLIEKVCASCGVHCIQVLQHEQRAYYCVVAWQEGDRWHFLRLDCCDDYMRDARALMKVEELLAGREMDPASGFYVPAPEKNFLYYLLKKIEKGSVNAQQLAYLRNNLSACRKDMMLELSRYLTTEQIQEMFQCLAQDDTTQFQTCVSDWQVTLKKITKPSLKSRYYELVRVVQRIIRPTGVWIVIYGQDGTVIASAIEMLQPEMSPAFRRTADYHLGFYKKRFTKAEAGSPSDLPEQKSISAFNNFCVIFDYIVGYALKVLPAKARSTFVICDRIYENFWADPINHSRGGSSLLRKAVRAFTPEPDLVFYLDASAEVFQTHKQEIPEDERERLVSNIYCRRYVNQREVHVINSAQSIDSVVRIMQAVVILFMEKRMLQLRC
jgi:hypothetical protein